MELHRLHFMTLYYIVLYYIILYFTLLYYTILYYTILYYTILYYTILYYTILYYTILYYTILYYTILYYTILYYTILYYTILYYTILYYTILYYTILYYTILYYTILYYTILYYTKPLYTIYYILYTLYHILYYTVGHSQRGTTLEPLGRGSRAELSASNPPRILLRGLMREAEPWNFSYGRLDRKPGRSPPISDPESPSTQYFRTLAPKPFRAWFLGPETSNIGHLDPLANCMLHILHVVYSRYCILYITYEI